MVTGPCDLYEGFLRPKLCNQHKLTIYDDLGMGALPWHNLDGSKRGSSEVTPQGPVFISFWQISLKSNHHLLRVETWNLEHGMG
jgi:hypothetical protein